MKNLFIIATYCFFSFNTAAQVSLAVVKKIDNTLYDILDTNTGEMVSFTKTDNYTDSSRMDQSKCDNVIFLKYNNDYYKRNYSGQPNIKWFGCSESISNNETIINKVLKNYKGAFIPAGQFIFSSTITVPQNAVLIGVGKNAVLKLVSRSPTIGISINRGSSLSNFKIDCSATDMDESPALLVNAWNDVGSSLDELTIQNISIAGNYPQLQGAALRLAIRADNTADYSVIVFCKFYNIDIYGFRNGIDCMVDYAKGKNISYINANIFENIIIHRCLRPVRLINNASDADIISGKAAIASNIFTNIIVQHVTGNYPVFFMDGAVFNKINGQIIDWKGNYAECTGRSRSNTFDLLPEEPGKIKNAPK